MIFRIVTAKYEANAAQSVYFIVFAVTRVTYSNCSMRYARLWGLEFHKSTINRCFHLFCSNFTNTLNCPTIVSRFCSLQSTREHAQAKKNNGSHWMWDVRDSIKNDWNNVETYALLIEIQHLHYLRTSSLAFALVPNASINTHLIDYKS